MHLAITSENTESGKLFHFTLLDTSLLCEYSTESSSDTVSAFQIPLHIGECIEQPVGLLADGRLVFLDKALWVCTAQLWLPSAGLPEMSETAVTRHFFIPRDWLNSAGLGLCRVQADGKFLCPCKDEIAVIRSDIGGDW
ncbi:hypothetical protein PHISCL_08272 [Aspergillus sclerotialis]|uniref:Uncharacterized protein n=1 Tax=Aspergillus sclerotialis TaxID=2070753 RepID=A0A3A2ZND6_9EURO|nr:hypothetical protein PHISCL_08272 [Aspergillus sclerotialis]